MVCVLTCATAVSSIAIVVSAARQAIAFMESSTIVPDASRRWSFHGITNLWIRFVPTGSRYQGMARGPWVALAFDSARMATEAQHMMLLRLTKLGYVHPPSGLVRLLSRCLQSGSGCRPACPGPGFSAEHDRCCAASNGSRGGRPSASRLRMRYNRLERTSRRCCSCAIRCARPCWPTVANRISESL